MIAVPDEDNESQIMPSPNSNLCNLWTLPDHIIKSVVLLEGGREKDHYKPLNRFINSSQRPCAFRIKSVTSRTAP